MFSVLGQRLEQEKLAKAQTKAKAQGYDNSSSQDDTVVSQVAITGKGAVKVLDWQSVQQSLKQDLEYVRTLAGSQEKTPFKRELIEKYRSTAEGLLESHSNYENLELLWWWFLWQIDVGELEQVHDRFKHTVLNGLTTPAHFKSTAHTAYCDIIYDYSNDAFTNAGEFNQQYLIDAVADLQNGTLAANAVIKGKLFKLLGDIYEKDDKLKQALSLFEQLMAIDPRGGRKTKIKEIQEKLNHGEE